MSRRLDYSKPDFAAGFADLLASKRESDIDVSDAVEAIMIEKADFISERGMSAVGPLMGLVMQKLGGSADGKIVSQVLRDKISKHDL